VGPIKKATSGLATDDIATPFPFSPGWLPLTATNKRNSTLRDEKRAGIYMCTTIAQTHLFRAYASVPLQES